MFTNPKFFFKICTDKKVLECANFFVNDQENGNITRALEKFGEELVDKALFGFHDEKVIIDPSEVSLNARYYHRTIKRWFNCKEIYETYNLEFNNIDCTNNCIDCYGCIECRDCKNCVGCYNIVKSRDCDDCVGDYDGSYALFYCRNCVKSSDLFDCVNCVDCYQISYFIGCKGCSNDDVGNDFHEDDCKRVLTELGKEELLKPSSDDESDESDDSDNDSEEEGSENDEDEDEEDSEEDEPLYCLPCYLSERHCEDCINNGNCPSCNY